MNKDEYIEYLKRQSVNDINRLSPYYEDTGQLITDESERKKIEESIIDLWTNINSLHNRILELEKRGIK